MTEPRERQLAYSDGQALMLDEASRRAKAAKIAKMRVAEDLTYGDLGLAQPEGGADEVGDLLFSGSTERKIPAPA